MLTTQTCTEYANIYIIRPNRMLTCQRILCCEHHKLATFWWILHPFFQQQSKCSLGFCKAKSTQKKFRQIIKPHSSTRIKRAGEEISQSLIFVSSTVYDASLSKLLWCWRFLVVSNFCYYDLLIIHIRKTLSTYVSYKCFYTSPILQLAKMTLLPLSINKKVIIFLKNSQWHFHSLREYSLQYWCQD